METNVLGCLLLLLSLKSQSSVYDLISISTATISDVTKDHGLGP